MTKFAFARMATPEPALAVVVDDRVRLLADFWPDTYLPRTIGELLGDWQHHVDTVSNALAAGNGTEGWDQDSAIQFLAPVDEQATLYCCGANYYDHVEEMGESRPDKGAGAPFHFVLPLAAVQGHRGDVVRPQGVQQLDWEVELAAVIGRTASHVSPERALEYVAGYTVANDVSCRDQQQLRHKIFGVNWLWSKGQATLKPIGPALVPSGFVPDPSALQISLSVDGVLRQDSNTGEMIYTLSEQIAALSHQAPLHPGDVILTGTPAGTAAAHGSYLEDGSVMVAEVHGVGRLQNRIAGTA